jgi:peptidoglycan/xylan/chitin deacetylase (PgdA/CDA1 family)
VRSDEERSREAMPRSRAFALVALLGAALATGSRSSIASESGRAPAAREAPAAAPTEPDTTSPAAPVDHEFVPREETRAIVVAYHDIAYPETARGILPRSFMAHMDTLARSGASVVRLRELVEFLEGKRQLPRHAVVLIFDDGDAGVATHAAPLLEKLRFPYTIAAPTSVLEAASRRGGTIERRLLSWATLRRLLASGLCEIASHGHDHRSLAALAPALREREIVGSRTLFAEQVGVAPTAYVYPMGSYDRDALEALRSAGYRAGFASVGGVITHATDPMRIPRYLVPGRGMPTAMHEYLRRAGVTVRARTR